MVNFEHMKLTRTRTFQKFYPFSKFNVGKTKVEINLPLKATATFKKRRTTRIPLQLQDSTAITRFTNTI